MSTHEKDFGKVVKLLRIRRGWKQEYMAKQLKISTAAVSRIENGLTGINLSHILYFADFFGVPPYVMLAEMDKTVSRKNVSLKAELEAKIKMREDEIVHMQELLINLYEDVRGY